MKGYTVTREDAILAIAVAMDGTVRRVNGPCVTFKFPNLATADVFRAVIVALIGEHNAGAVCGSGFVVIWVEENVPVG